MNKSLIAIVILTYNEELHIARAINSAKKVSSNIIIVDSYSTDRTREICENLNVKYVCNKFIDHASQLNWALENVTLNSEWIIRLDADEYFTDELIKELGDKTKNLDQSIGGVYFKRRLYFMGRWIKYGGYYPTRILRMWRNGAGEFEQRSMDEHFNLTDGSTLHFKNDFIDENLNSLSWWIKKHNGYATKEAMDILCGPKKEVEISGSLSYQRSELSKRWYKSNIYLKLPLFIRPVLYFIYRYFIKLGFLDGRVGFLWHFLQGLWYRSLVDAKIFDIQRRAHIQSSTLHEIFDKDYNFQT